MKNFLRTIVLSLSLAVTVVAGPALATAYAQDNCNGTDVRSALNCGVVGANPSGDNGQDPNKTLSDTVATGLDVLSIVVGILAVIMIIVGGVRMITSSGNPDGVKSARGAITYALIGLVVVALAQIIVHFVLEKTKKAVGGDTTSMIWRA